MSTLISEPIKVKFIGHTWFYAQKGLTGITGNIYAGLHEFEEMAFLLHFLKADDIFFDVGANLGSYTILASGVKKAKTIAFEPIPVTYSSLVKNVELNELQNLVITQNKGVGKKECQLNFVADKDTINHIVFNNDEKSITVDIVPLNSFYPNYIPALIKIDVEGFEKEVINGASKILNDKSLKAIIIELNGSGERYGFNDEEIHKKLLALSFTPVKYNPFERGLVGLDTFGKCNTIYVRDINFVKERIKSSVSFKVLNEII